MKREIEKMYKRQKSRRIKAVAVCIITFVMTMTVISIFLGNPFPHKENVLFLQVTYPGWINTDGYLLCLCSMAGCLSGIGNVLWSVLKPFRELDQVLLQQCDAKGYLEWMEYAVTYGKGLNCGGVQKTVLLLAEQKYVVALIVNQKLEDAEHYLNEQWIGKRRGKQFAQVLTNLELIKRYNNKETDSYCKALQVSGKEFSKNRLFVAKGFFLKQDYEAALELLVDHEEKISYYEVGRKFLLGKCYDKLGDLGQATTCMEYVAEKGNTMPHRKWAQEWLTRKSLPILEQK